jgi:hypothetical protein
VRDPLAQAFARCESLVDQAVADRCVTVQAERSALEVAGPLLLFAVIGCVTIAVLLGLSFLNRVRDPPSSPHEGEARDVPFDVATRVKSAEIRGDGTPIVGGKTMP